MRAPVGPPELFIRAKQLRRNMTLGEHVLWRELRKKKLGVQFRRQEPFAGFILDFSAPAATLAVEVDGDIHDCMSDFERDQRLAAFGVMVLRFTNDEVQNELHRVLAETRASVADRHHPQHGPRPPPRP